MIDLAVLGGTLIGKVGYAVKKRVIDQDKDQDESEFQSIARWFVKKPVTTLISLLIAYVGALNVGIGSEGSEPINTVLQSVMAGLAGDTVANKSK